MKKIIALSAILSLSAAFAEDVVYGTFVLNSSEPEVILGVPWVNPGSNEAIPVTDLIQTSTLEAGDQVLYYDLKEKGYVVWQLNSSKAWVCGTPGATGDETLVRGNAIILKRDMTKEVRSKNIIINGQVGTSDVGAMAMAKGTKTTPAYTLVAPSSATETVLNAGNWTNVGAGDMIVIGQAGGKMAFYYYDVNKQVWGTRSLNDEWQYVITDAQAKIPAGQGVWFVSDGSEGESAVTCQWK